MPGEDSMTTVATPRYETQDASPPKLFYLVLVVTAALALTAFCAETLSFIPDPLGGVDEDRPENSTSQGTPLTLRDHFEHLKVWTTGAYYSSEAGLREMGWTGKKFFLDFPGCQHPEGHA